MVFARVLFVVLAVGTFTSCSCSEISVALSLAPQSQKKPIERVPTINHTNSHSTTLKSSASSQTTPASSNTKATTVSFLSTSKSSALDSTNITVSQNHVNNAKFNYNDLPNCILEMLHNSQLKEERLKEEEERTELLNITPSNLENGLQSSVSSGGEVMFDPNITDSSVTSLPTTVAITGSLPGKSKSLDFNDKAQSSSEGVDTATNDSSNRYEEYIPDYIRDVIEDEMEKPIISVGVDYLVHKKIHPQRTPQSSLPSGSTVTFDPTRTDYSVKVVSNVTHSPTGTFVSSVVQPAKPSQHESYAKSSQSPPSSSSDASSLNLQATGSTVKTSTPLNSKKNLNVTVLPGNGSFDVKKKQIVPVGNSPVGSQPQTLCSDVFSEMTTSSTTKSSQFIPSTTISTTGPAVFTHTASISQNQQRRSLTNGPSRARSLALSLKDNQSTIPIDTVLQSQALTSVSPTNLTNTAPLQSANTQHLVHHSLSAHQSSILTTHSLNSHIKSGNSDGKPNSKFSIFDDEFGLPLETPTSDTSISPPHDSLKSKTMPQFDWHGSSDKSPEIFTSSTESSVSPRLLTAGASVGANGNGRGGPKSLKTKAYPKGYNMERGEPVGPVDPAPSSSKLGAPVAAVIVVVLLCVCLLGLVFYRRTKKPAEQGDIETGHVEAGKSAGESKPDPTVDESPKQP